MADLTPDEFGVKFISGYFIKGDENIIIVEEGCRNCLGKLFSALRELGFKDHILHLYVTHIHIDHAGSVGSILNKVHNSKAYLHPRGIKHLVDPSKLWRVSKESLGYIAELYGEPESASEEKLYAVDNGWIHEVENNRFEFIYTEGHASHHVSIFWHNNKALFVGDSAGIYIREIDYLIPGTIYPVRLDLYVKSLKKMLSYNPRYLMYPHYGMVDNGVKVLKNHLKQIIRYFDVAKSSNVKDLDNYLRLLADEDESLSLLLEMSKDIPIIKVLINLSFLGILKESERLESI
jgi:glyoxylase-like metal-dependent hydrolase (beta-lactamase superfamily II)